MKEKILRWQTRAMRKEDMSKVRTAIEWKPMGRILKRFTEKHRKTVDTCASDL